MKWPWVSRARLDASQAEVLWLREQTERLSEQLTRVVRSTNGMSETPVRPRDKKEIKRMPDELRRHLDQIGSRAMRQVAVQEAYRRYARDGSWGPVMAESLPDPKQKDDE